MDEGVVIRDDGSSADSARRPLPAKVGVWFVLAALLVAGLCVPGLYYSVADGTNACLHERAGLDLSDWLAVGCMVPMICVAGLLIVITCSSEYHLRLWLPFLHSIYVAHDLFVLGWVVAGIVYGVTDENRACITQGQDVGIVSLAWMCLSVVLCAPRFALINAARSNA